MPVRERVAISILSGRLDRTRHRECDDAPGFHVTRPDIGYTLSSEEHDPSTLVANAKRAEEAGFDFVSSSDHFHPWIDRQGHSPFVWSVIGGVASTTTTLGLGTGVTCPTV